MIAIPRTIDAGSKRWLVVLAATAATSVIFMAYSFIQTLSPAEPAVVAPQKSAPAPPEEPVTRSEPDWNAAQAVQGSQAAPAREDPFASEYAAAAKHQNNQIAHQQAVHRQAEYLRNLISQGKLPGCFGTLTKEQVDEMERKGITIQ
ncbi:MAG: hypothetical protein ABSA12_00885 [Verrucomicrobiia bacterium]